MEGIHHHTLESDLITSGENIHTSEKCPCEVKMLTRGENVHVGDFSDGGGDTPPYL